MTTQTWRQPPKRVTEQPAGSEPEISHDQLAILLPPIPLAKVGDIDVEGEAFVALINQRRREYYDYFKKSCEYLLRVMSALGVYSYARVTASGNYSVLTLKIKQSFSVKYGRKDRESAYYAAQDGSGWIYFGPDGFPLRYGRTIVVALEEEVRMLSEYAKSLL